LAVQEQFDAQGTLRLELDGVWSVEDFGDYLRRLNRAYQAADAVSLLVAEPDFFYRYGWPVPGPYPPDFRYRPPDKGELRALAASRAAVLEVKSVEFSSPGWIEVIGSLNPLRVVADAVAQWRAENRERGRQSRAFQLELLDRLPPAAQAQYAAELLEETLDQTKPLALDRRITRIELTNGGSSTHKDHQR